MFIFKFFITYFTLWMSFYFLILQTGDYNSLLLQVPLPVNPNKKHFARVVATTVTIPLIYENSCRAQWQCVYK